MKFAFIPKGQYTIGQIIKVHGQPMRVESYTHTGRNVIVHTLAGSPKFKRIVCICTDIQSIEEISNWQFRVKPYGAYLYIVTMCYFINFFDRC